MKKENLKEKVEQDKKDRVAKCAKELEKLLVEYDCKIDVSVIITQQGNFPQINITAK